MIPELIFDVDGIEGLLADYGDRVEMYRLNGQAVQTNDRGPALAPDLVAFRRVLTRYGQAQLSRFAAATANIAAAGVNRMKGRMTVSAF